MSDEKAVDAYTDFIEPFLIDHSSIRGRFVRLSTVLDDILNAHHYPLAVSMHLAEQIVIACMLSATLVKDGILTVQAKGDGPIRFMVVDVLADGTIRGYAQMDEEELKRIIGKSKKKQDIGVLLGKGYLAVTLDDGKSKERYQGIVELVGESLSDAFKGYFMQSQQGEIALNIAVQPPAKRGESWKGGGVIVERMPIAGGKQVELDIDEQNEIWERTKLFMQTLKPKEMLDRRITPQNLLYRLFNEDGVWVYKVQPLKAGCRCSRKRIREVLKTIPKQDLIDSLDTEGKMSVNCQFCNKTEVFKREDINRLYRTTTRK
ncbi:MAG TPA: Hsp33 family molecular chaperone HslO [Rickettsiales bacterium]|nr:Hsp33 family molecular chaperone HslO [Rickettsiales bacterium]